MLNTNLHVYHVSPALTIIEKTTTRKFANLFGFDGPHAGGISTQGGSASNTTAIVVARNTLFPDTKDHGHGAREFVLFTSQHGHYSMEKAAIMCGFGRRSVRSIPVDSDGRMDVIQLERLIIDAKSKGKTPFFVNATAGTTVLGSYDPFCDIARVCSQHNLWLHIDACWGGPAIFSSKLRWKLEGSHLANSLAINPHKMMGVPVTCSLLLTQDIRKFHQANSLPAGYIFHRDEAEEEVWDLADMTLQCGRRGDTLKVALGWVYYGAEGYASQIEGAFETASYAVNSIRERKSLRILPACDPPPCLQVCFYYTHEGVLSEDVSW